MREGAGVLPPPHRSTATQPAGSCKGRLLPLRRLARRRPPADRRELRLPLLEAHVRPGSASIVRRSSGPARPDDAWPGHGCSDRSAGRSRTPAQLAHRRRAPSGRMRASLTPRARPQPRWSPAGPSSTTRSASVASAAHTAPRITSWRRRVGPHDDDAIAFAVTGRLLLDHVSLRSSYSRCSNSSRRSGRAASRSLMSAASSIRRSSASSARNVRSWQCSSSIRSASVTPSPQTRPAGGAWVAQRGEAVLVPWIRGPAWKGLLPCRPRGVSVRPGADARSFVSGRCQGRHRARARPPVAAGPAHAET